MTLSELCIKRPVMASMMSLGLVIFGVVGLQRLPVRELPDVDPPVVSVTSVFPGASAEIVETEVTEPIEEAIAGVEGLKKITSESREQLSQITVEFSLTRNVDLAAQDVRDRVSRVRGRLPDDIDEPVVAKQDADARPILWVALFSDRYSTLELTTLAENVLKDPLQSVDGVSSVFLGGAKRFAIRVWLDPQKMAAHQVTVQDVEQTLRTESLELPSGRVENREREISIETRGELKTPEEYNRLVLRNDGDSLVRLRDVGYAEIGVEDERAHARYNSKPAMGLGIVRQSKANTVAVAKGVKEEVQRLHALLPEGVDTFIAYDESVYIEKSIREVWITLGIAFLLVVLAIFFFLHNMRATIVPTITIPISLIATFGAMYALGFSINTITMLALVLAIGIVVDDSIVVLENIYRHIQEGQEPRQAAINGMKEITFAVLATTVALVAVFLPLSFQTSDTGRLFIEFAIALTFSVIVSTFVALTLAPMICARFLSKPEPARGVFAVFERGLDGLTHNYTRVMRKALKHPFIVFTITTLLFGGAVFFYTKLDKEFLPEEDKGRLFCILITPEGSTSEYTDRMVQKMEGMIAATPEVDGYFSAVALGRGGPGKASEGLAFIRLKEGKRRHVRDIVGGPTGLGGQFFGGIEGAFAIPIIPKAIGGGFGQSFQLVLENPDLQELNRYAGELSNQLRGLGTLQNVRTTFELNKPQLRLNIDRDRAARLGVSVETISRALQVMFGGTDLAKVKRDGKQYDVIVQLARDQRLTPSAINQLYMRSASGELVQLSSLVSYEETGGPSAIQRTNRLRSATIEATPLVPLGRVMESVEGILAKQLPPGFRYEWAGEAEDLIETGRETWFIFFLAIFIIYMVLAAQFESLVHPLTVLLTLPLAAVGAFGALWILARMGVPAMGVNLFSQIGMILLVGLVTKNAILLIDFANSRVREGWSAYDAMVEAGRIRLRPILMTAISTIIGILPIAIGFGAGAESRRPLGVAAVGGMAVATLLTLVVIPVVYVFFSSITDFLTHHEANKERPIRAPHNGSKLFALRGKERS